MTDSNTSRVEGASRPAAAGWTVMNIVFATVVFVAVLTAAYTGRMKDVSEASFTAAKDAVTLAISLVGVMAFWLGMVKVLEAGGVVRGIARALRPIMIRLFPDVPADHPAMGAMVMNIAANMMGLGNAATPFGIKAMMELNRLNPLPGTATNAMCLFLAINTSSVTLLPLGSIAVRAAAGSASPAAIFLPTLLATICSTVFGVVAAILWARRDVAYQTLVKRAGPEERHSTVEQPTAESFEHLLVAPGGFAPVVGKVGMLLLLVFLLVHVFGSGAGVSTRLGDVLNNWLMPTLIFSILCFALVRGVKIYDALTEGAKQGFEVAVRIIPFLVAILVAISMFRASGAMEVLTSALNPFTALIGMPAEALPMAIIRPLSGSGAFAIMSEVVQQAPDSYPAFVVSVMNGAADTTFYILAVYFGAVGVTRVRHAVAAGLVADLVGMLAASLFSMWMFGWF